ncbi:DUF4407 domain-containing protein [Nocardia higoensis]|uniref:DUF4407 domain-containing protein n=1 Tax=Nocardia higoensis TaxID=228599 RepID=UPI0002D36EA2|nr:DUF4407 domain-containing protein [Nocardia higoensis]
MSTTRMSATGMLVRIGGAQPSAVAEAHERAGYALTGAAVTVSALVAGGVAAAACAPMWPVAVVIAAAAGAVAVAAVIARAVASSPGTAPRRLWFLGRVLLALVLGVFIGEAATVVATAAAVDRILDEKAHAAAVSAPEVLAAETALERAETDRAALRSTITEGETEVERALVTARCEFNPTDQCPPTRITGVPGDGPEHRAARAMLDDARARLAAARDRAPALEQRVTEAEQGLAAAYSAADRAGDRGPGARWAAMHEHTTASAAALPTRLAALLGGVLIALLPLLVRRWLGVTSQDRHAAARAAMDAAERDAETAIAVQRARIRAAAEELRADRAIEAGRLTTGLRTATPLPELGAAEPLARAVRAGATTAYPAAGPESLAAGSRSATTHGSATSPGSVAAPGSASAPGSVPASGSAAAPGSTAERSAGSGIPTGSPIRASERATGADAPVVETFGDGRRHTRVIAAIGGLEIGITEFARPGGAAPEHGAAALPGLGNLPFAEWLGPLVPSFVLGAVDSATRPLRTARRAIDDVEELTFTLRHNRVITVAVRETVPGAGVGSGRAVTATVVDVEPVLPVELVGAAPEAGESADSHARSAGTRFH